MSYQGQHKPWMGALLIALGVVGWSGDCGAVAVTNAPMIAALRYVAEAPVVDGKLSDPAWAKADILTGFIVPVALDSVQDQSEVRLVCDEKRLYVGLKAYESSINLMQGKGDTPFGSDNFELFIQPNLTSGTYYHMAVSATGNSYTAKERSSAWKPALEVKTGVEKKCWTAELSIPLADLGMSAPIAGAESKMRVNICRTDMANPGMNPKDARFTPFSSFAPLTDLNFHHPETWAEVIMTRGSEVPRMITNKSPTINLLTNPEFNFAVSNNPVAWACDSGDVTRQETMALSGEWIIKASGNAYVFLKRWTALEAGTTYTVRIKARRFGDCALGFGQIVKKGADYPMAPVLWDCPLTTEFAYYHATFTALGNPVMLALYRMGPHTTTDGIDIASVHVFEGVLSPFEIRKIARGGAKQPIKGTELPIPANTYGVRNETLNVLAIAASLQSAREYVEIFAGLNIDADILITSGKNQDTYYTDNDPDMIKNRLDKNQYGLYMVGHRTINRPGEALAKKIGGNIEQGAGLVMNNSKEDGNFRELLAKYKPQAVATNHYLKAGLPLALCPLTKDPTSVMMESKAGTGRIVVTDIGGEEFKSPLMPEAYSYITFPCQHYSSAWLARLIYYAAGKSQSIISDVVHEGGKVAVHCRAAVKDAELGWQLDDKNGTLVAKGAVPFKDDPAYIPLPAMTLAGQHALRVWLKDSKGAILDYCARTVKHDGPSITDCASAKEFYTGNDEGVFTVRVHGFDATMRVGWTLEDFAGRTLDSGSVRAAETVKLNVPLTAVYTGLARLWVHLRSGSKELDAQRFAVYLPDRDRPRMLNDFNVSVWPAAQSPDVAHSYINRQLEQIGVRAQSPVGSAPVILNDGFAAGSTLNLGDIFCCLYPSKGHVRNPSVSDPDVLKNMATRVEKQAKATHKYGLMSAMICDEPNDGSPSGSEETDAHPENLKEYRRRMQVKYGTIEKFNARCSTAYTGFAEIGLVLTQDARSRTNFAEFVEWRNYNVDRWVESFRICVDSFHSQSPDVPIALANSFGPRALSCNDFWKLLTHTGFGFSNEYTSMVYLGDNPFYDFDELYRSFRPDMRVWGWVGYFWTNIQQATFEPWWFALHRYGGFAFYAATSFTPGSGSYNLIDVPGLGLTELGRLVKDGLSDSKLLDGIGKVFLEYDWKKRDIAILYSQPSMLVAWCRGKEKGRDGLVPGSPYYNWHHSRNNIRYLLEELLYQYDFISPEQIQQGVLDSYNVLILPHIESLSNDEVAQIKTFMERGGTVMTDIAPAAYDDLGTPRKEAPFKATMDKKLVVFNALFKSKDAGQSETMLSLLKERGIEPIVQCNDAVSTHGREAMHFVNGDMNVYAITRNFARSIDEKEQTFTFPTHGFLYDLREGKYLGQTNQVSCAIPNAGTKVFGHYPYQVKAVKIDVASKVQGGKDLVALINVKTSEGKAGHHVFHIEVVPPKGEVRWFMKRNVAAPKGRVKFTFRMAENDPKGKWTLRVTDIMTGTTESKSIQVY